MAKKSMPNIHDHLIHVGLIMDAYEKYGDCPLVVEEMRKIAIHNKAILRKHQAKRDAGCRKDIRI